MAIKKHFAERYDDPTFYLCWRRQSCGDCLTKEDGVSCSWCPLVCSMFFSSPHSSIRFFFFLFVFSPVYVVPQIGVSSSFLTLPRSRGEGEPFWPFPLSLYCIPLECSPLKLLLPSFPPIHPRFIRNVKRNPKNDLSSYANLYSRISYHTRNLIIDNDLMIPSIYLLAQSSICVPDRSRFPILAPFHDPEICPFGPSERWELRTRPLGCQVSTFSLLMSVSAVIGTLLLIGLLSFTIFVGKRVRASWRRAKRGRTETSLWRNVPRSWRRMRVWKWRGTDNSRCDTEVYYHDERSPLLGRE